MLRLLYDSEFWKPGPEDLCSDKGLADRRNKFLQVVQECSRQDRMCNDNIQVTLEVEEFTTTACCYKMDWRDNVFHGVNDRKVVE